MFYVFLYGVLLYETSDELLAYSIASSYRGIGHKNVTVKNG
jgi:hypothetical protein